MARKRELALTSMVFKTGYGSIGMRMERSGFKGHSRMVFGKVNGLVGGKMEGNLKRRTLNSESGTGWFNNGILTVRRI